MKTTLNKIRACSPCGLKPRDGVYTGLCLLMQNLGKTTTDDEPVSIMTILESNGINDALWCLKAVDGYDREKRLLAADFARSVQHLMTDPRSIAVIDVTERYANGLATDQELAASRAAAGAAAWAASRAAAGAAAWAAGDAAWAASRAAARAAAGAAARAAGDAAGAAAGAAGAASRAAQATLLCIVCAEIEQGED